MVEFIINKPDSRLTVSYNVGEGFYVDIVNLRNGTYEAWLYHETIGVKDFMFGIKETRTDFLETVNANLEEYIAIYELRYMTSGH